MMIPKDREEGGGIKGVQTGRMPDKNGLGHP